MSASPTLDQVVQIEFDSMVKAAYQSKGYQFNGAFYTKTGFVGDSVDMRKKGYARATQRAYQSDLVLQDPNFGKVTCVVKPYDCTYGIDEQETFLVNFDIRKEYSENISMGLGRTADQVHLDALANSGTTNIIGDDATALTYDKMVAAKTYFDKLNIPVEDRFCVISAYGLSSLFKQNQFISNDFNTKKVENGKSDEFFLGMKLIQLGDMEEGGLPLDGNIRTCYAFHRLAMGYAYNDAPHGKIFFEDMKNSYICTGLMQVGAICIDPKGVIEIKIDETK